MIYISCSDEEYELTVSSFANSEYECPKKEDGHRVACYGDCFRCWGENIKRINADITPDTPNYSTEAENKAFLQGFNVAVKKMRGEVEE